MTSCLKEKCEMKDFLDFRTHTKNEFFCVSIQLFRTNNSHPLTNPIVVRHLEAGKEQFRHYNKYKTNFLVPKYHILLLFLLTMHRYQLMTQIVHNCVITSNRDIPTILHENSVVFIAQIKEGFIKGDKTNHISPKFFSTHDLQKESDIKIQKIQLSNNLTHFLRPDLKRWHETLVRFICCWLLPIPISVDDDPLQSFLKRDYKWGFDQEIDSFTIPKGISKETVIQIEPLLSDGGIRPQPQSSSKKVIGEGVWFACIDGLKIRMEKVETHMKRREATENMACIDSSSIDSSSPFLNFV
ncbi:hypothetical protein LXL04_003464 [Taraxacum kok-saghyz]